MVAHQQQEQLTREVQEAHRNARTRLGFVIFCFAAILLFGIPAGMVGIFSHAYIPATILGILTLLAVAADGLCLQIYLKARENEQMTRECGEENRNARRRLCFVFFCFAAILLFVIPAGMVGFFSHAYIPATILGILTLLAVAADGLCLQIYLKARENEQEADQ